MAAYQIELGDPEKTVSELAEFLSEILASESVPPDIENSIQLAAEEAVVNIMKHGYKGAKGFIGISCDIHDNIITLCVRDRAPHFNPLTLPSPDVEADLDERRIGGLGVYLIRSLMDDVRYKETSSGNCLVMEKRISS